MNTQQTEFECPFDKHLRAYRDKAMSDNRRLEVRTHIRQCPACRANLALMKAVDAELSAWANQIQPSSPLRGRIKADLDVNPAASRGGRTDGARNALPLLRRPAFVWISIGVLLIAVMVVVLPMMLTDRGWMTAGQVTTRMPIESIGPHLKASYEPEAPASPEDATGRAGAGSLYQDSGGLEHQAYTRAAAPSGTPPSAPVGQQAQPASGALNARSTTSTDFDEFENWGRKIVYTATVDLTVPKLADAQGRLRDMVLDAGGYIGESTFDSNSGTTPSGSWTLHIPSYSYEQFMGRLQGLGTVNTWHQDSQDVTDQYTDLTARIANKRIEENRLQNLMATRRRGDDIVELESEVEDVQGDIEELQGQLNVMKHQAAFSTISLTMSEATPATPLPATFGTTFAGAWKGSIDGVASVGKAILLLVAADWPWLIVLAIAIMLLRNWWRRRKMLSEDD